MIEQEITNFTHTNRLIHETSPYLLQHAHNPVDWYPWGDEALEKARQADKPIFLSIGYSACHWCHVMAHESFEDEETAEVMNRLFVNIKVDREERPDLDDIYMTSVQLMTGQGGWPMSVFLTPDLKPFYGGTYFPPRSHGSMPGFRSVLTAVANAWEKRRDEVLRGADELADHVNRAVHQVTHLHGPIEEAVLDKAVGELKQAYDGRHGGFGGAPKFPPSGAIALLLRHYDRTGDMEARDMAIHTLRAMALGGMYDHVGGGFHRYSVDERWLVPHFEKMLYDNAQLCEVYLEGWQATGDPVLKRAAEQTLNYQLREMTHPEGGFLSAEDADSEGEEGAYYLWTDEEIRGILGREDADLYCEYYAISPSGNFASPEPYHADKNIPHATKPPEQFAEDRGMTLDEFWSRIDQLNAKLREARHRRVRPGRDDKILTSWNGLMIGAMAQGYAVLREPRYREGAERAARFIVDHLYPEAGFLLHSFRNGQARIPGYLDDYAFLANGLVTLYEATFDITWLRTAQELLEDMIFKFWDPESGGFYFTSGDDHRLIARPKPVMDGSEPSGNSAGALLLLRVSRLTDKRAYREKAETILGINAQNLEEAPTAMTKMLCAADFLLRPPLEVALAGLKDSEAVEALARTVHSHFAPNKILACTDGDGSGERGAIEAEIPLLKDKELVDGQPAAYLCKDFTCSEPITEPRVLAERLRGR